jgi:hypothetical protein
VPTREALKASRKRKAEKFYEGVLKKGLEKSAEIALEVVGVDQEVAVLRLYLRSLLNNDVLDYGLMLRCMETLRRFVEVKYDLPAQNQDALEAEMPAFRDALTEIVKGDGDDGNAGSDKR